MLYVECNPDLTLVKALTKLPKREISHQLKGKDEILKLLANQSNCQAMLDEDPGDGLPGYLSRMQVVADLGDLGIRVMDHQAQRNRVILLRPQLEEWIIRASQEVGIRPNDRRYNLPVNPRRLHREINTDLRKLERLIDDLVEAGEPRIQHLRNLLAA